MNNTVIFAGGCFWCVEHDLSNASGVISVVSGYTGGVEEDATYEKVTRHETEHREAVLITYDSNKTTFKKLTQFFLDHIDPTDQEGQFADRGDSYKTAIYYKTEEEKEIAQSLLKELDNSGLYSKPVSVDVLSEMPFYPAEKEHQKYAEKNPVRYSLYRQGSGRGSFLNKTCRIREEKKMKWRS